MSFLLLFLVFIVFIVIGVIGTLLNFFTAFFSFGRRRQKNSVQTNEQTAMRKNKKIFSKDDGEYVDFEEIKDE